MNERTFSESEINEGGERARGRYKDALASAKEFAAKVRDGDTPVTIRRKDWRQIQTQIMGLYVALEARDIKLRAVLDEIRTKHSDFRYVGPHKDGNLYREGNWVTHHGSVWHCNEATLDAPGTSKSFTLAIRKGRDGSRSRDGGASE